MALSDLGRSPTFTAWTLSAQPDSWAATLLWGFDLVIGWQSVYLATLVLGVLLWLVGLGTWKAWPLLFLALSAAPFVTQSPRTEGAHSYEGNPAANAAVLSVVSANLHYSNTNPGLILKWATEKKADVVALHEVSPTLAGALQKYPSSQYPYRLVEPSEGNFGIALLSRWPLTASKTTPLKSGGAAQLVKVTVAGLGDVAVMSVHPMPPVTAFSAVQRNRDLLSLAADTKTRAVMLGDFNATPWHPVLHELGRKGWGRATPAQATWPTATLAPTSEILGRSVGVGLSLDHVLATSDWTVVNASVGPDVGSDHLPVHATLRLKSTK